MAQAPGRYLVIAALAGAALLVAILWCLRQRAAPEPVPGTQVTFQGVTVPAESAGVSVAGQANATQSAPAAADGAASSGPDASVPGAGTAPPPLEMRQLAKIAHGMRPNPDGGILVEATPPGSVVGQLRLQPGDVIVSVDGVPATTPEQFARTYRERGLPQQLTVLRNGTEIHLH